MQHLTCLALNLAEQGLFPDVVLRRGVRQLLTQRLREVRSGDARTAARQEMRFIDEMSRTPFPFGSANVPRYRSMPCSRKMARVTPALSGNSLQRFRGAPYRKALRAGVRFLHVETTSMAIARCSVVIGDDTDSVRARLRTLLEAMPGISRVGEAADAPGTIAPIQSMRPFASWQKFVRSR